MNDDNLLLWLDRMFALLFVAFIAFLFSVIMIAVRDDLITWRHRQDILWQIELQAKYDEVMKDGN